jgi:ribosomal protein L7/L12
MTFQDVLCVFMALCMWRLFRISAQLDKQEAHWQSLLRHLGIDPAELAEPSEKVKALASQPGGRIEAIKAYRQQTGAGLKEAKAVVDKLAAESNLAR